MTGSPAAPEALYDQWQFVLSPWVLLPKGERPADTISCRPGAIMRYQFQLPQYVRMYGPLVWPAVLGMLEAARPDRW